MSYSGVVFPYFPSEGRYSLTFDDAVQACIDQGAVVAGFDQLYEAFKGGLDWCNAGWLSDGTVQYPITKPREPCGGSNSGPGVRNYGRRSRQSLFDVFCFSPAFSGEFFLDSLYLLFRPCLVDKNSSTKKVKFDSWPPVSLLLGHFYWLVQPDRLTYDEAVQACLDDDAEIAKVGHMYAAWSVQGYDRCDAGWLADGSVRYPISRPRKNCSPTEAAVRFVGFPDKMQKSYGVYCYKAHQWGAR